MDGLNLKFKLSNYDRYFLKKLPQSLKQLMDEELMEAKNRFVVIFNEESEHIMDEPGQSFQLMCSYMAAYYEKLNSKGLSKEKILDLLSESLIKSAGGNYVKWMTRIMLWIKRDKRKFIEKSTLQSKKTYGSFLDMREENAPKQFTSVITSCGFFDFFNRRGIPELTSIFCKWDDLWAKEINKQNCGVRFERPTTIAEGEESCRFEFYFL